MTLGSSSMAEMRSDKRSKQRRESGDLWAADATIDSNCATNTPNLDNGTFSLTNCFAMAAPIPVPVPDSLEGLSSKFEWTRFATFLQFFGPSRKKRRRTMQKFAAVWLFGGSSEALFK